MKKIALLLTIFLIGCQNTEKTINSVNDNIPILSISTNDVIDRHGKIENIERFKEFFYNVGNGMKDHVRVVKYTTEGDPILHELEYDGQTLKSVEDNRRDKYGVNEIITSSCTSIKTVENIGDVKYILDGCENDIDLVILKIDK